MRLILETELTTKVCKYGHVGQYRKDSNGASRCKACEVAQWRVNRKKSRENLLQRNPDADRERYKRYKTSMNERSKRYYLTVKDTPEFKEKANLRHKRYNSIPTNQVKNKARTDLIKAVSRKNYYRSDSCERCEQPTPVEGHHYDYSRSLDVLWLCKSCHEWLHHATIEDCRSQILQGLEKEKI